VGGGGRGGKVGRGDDASGVGRRRVAGDPAVAPAVDTRGCAARRGKRRIAEARQNARGSSVPDVGDHERTRPLMERTKDIALVELSGGHTNSSSSNVSECPTSGRRDLAARDPWYQKLPGLLPRCKHAWSAP